MVARSGAKMIFPNHQSHRCRWQATCGRSSCAGASAATAPRVNLDFIPRDNECQVSSLIGMEGWNGRANLPHGGLDGMYGIRVRGCQATGTAAWPRHTSSFSAATAPRANRTRLSCPNTRAKSWTAAGNAAPLPATPTLQDLPRPWSDRARGKRNRFRRMFQRASRAANVAARSRR